MKTWQQTVIDVACVLAGAALLVFGSVYGSEACLVGGSSLLSLVAGARAGQKSANGNGNGDGPKTGAVVGLVLGLLALLPLFGRRA